MGSKCIEVLVAYVCIGIPFGCIGKGLTWGSKCEALVGGQYISMPYVGHTSVPKNMCFRPIGLAYSKHILSKVDGR